MSITTPKILAFTVLPTLLMFSAGCSSSGPSAAEPGTPAFFWSSARQSFQTGDYVHASESLSKLTTSQNEYRTRAQAEIVVLSTGMVKGYMDYAEAYDAGSHANRDNALAFHRQASGARSQAKGVLLQAVEAFHELNTKVKDPNIAFEFGPPSGSLSEIGNLTRVGKGMLPPASDAEATQRKAIQNGVVWSSCRAVGAADDSAKASEILKQVPAQIVREKFLYGMAETLYEQSDLFGPKQLDEPLRMKMICNEALEALKQVSPSKETKELETKIQKVMKSVRAT